MTQPAPASDMSASTETTGADTLVNSLHACGIQCVFMEDHPAMTPVANAINAAGTLRMLNPISEIACVPMADAYSRYTGEPVASITAGGGHCLNQVMGTTTAWGDKTPVIVIGIQDDHPLSTAPVFDRETLSVESVFKPISVYSVTVQKPDDIAVIVVRAVRESLSAKGGTAYIEIPRSFLEAPVAMSLPTERQSGTKQPVFAQQTAPPMAEPETIQQALLLLRNARKPFIFAGGGVLKANAVNAINDLAKQTGIPLLSSMGALDAVYPDNPMYIGPSSYLSGEAFHKAIKKADVVLSVGACFSGLDGFGLPPIWSGDIKFIQVNIDHQYIALNPGAEIPIITDARQAVEQMLTALAGMPAFPDRTPWITYLKNQNRAHQQRLAKEARCHKPDSGRLHPAAGILAVQKTLEESDAIAVVDGGNTPLWAGMSVALKGPRRMFFPTGMATLGVGIPMALGIKAAAPDKPVMLLTGDGSMLYNIQELELMKKYNLPLVIIVNNDSAWNMIRSGEVMINRSISTDLPEQDYAKVAEAFGMEVVRIRTLADITPDLISRALGGNYPMLIDIPTDRDVFPDSLVSFIRVEMMGVLVPQPLKKMRRMHQSQAKLFSRNTWNIIKYLIKTY
ncbi:MAG: thiamine pyrophosphate-binding protein [Thermodesulfobacteriota bacterium]|nr:thiamine pyrophosphate-binding protein [Thermodesulfobacteriota bacterium]